MPTIGPSFSCEQADGLFFKPAVELLGASQEDAVNDSNHISAGAAVQVFCQQIASGARFESNRQSRTAGKLSSYWLHSATLAGFVIVRPIGFFAIKPVFTILACFLFSALFLFFAFLAAVAHVYSLSSSFKPVPNHTTLGRSGRRDPGQRASISPNTRGYVLRYFQSSLRTGSFTRTNTQGYVLGNFQPELSKLARRLICSANFIG
jgi:hypothetical protein